MEWTRTAVAALLGARGIRLRRSLGQNYLVDANFLEALARDSGAGPGDHVVEIGSGLGNLTERLAARAGRVTAFEVDPAVYALSTELLSGRPNLELRLEDGARFAERVGAGPLRIVSNLPYGAWQDLVLAILEAPQEILSATLMVQADVYERLKSGPGTRLYGPMSVLVQGTCGLKRIRRAGRELFLPVPGVDSTVFALTRAEPVAGARDLLGVLERLFEGRRKKSSLAGGRRVESLGPGELLALAKQVLGGHEHKRE